MPSISGMIMSLKTQVLEWCASTWVLGRAAPFADRGAVIALRFEAWWKLLLEWPLSSSHEQVCFSTSTGCWLPVSHYIRDGTPEFGGVAQSEK